MSPSSWVIMIMLLFLTSNNCWSQKFSGVSIGMNAFGRIRTDSPISKESRLLPKMGVNLLGEIGLGASEKGNWRVELGYQFSRIDKRIDSQTWYDKRVTSWHGVHFGFNRVHFGFNRSFTIMDSEKSQWSISLGLSLDKIFLNYVNGEGRMYDSSNVHWDNYSYGLKGEDQYSPFCFGLQTGVEYVLKIKETKSLE